MGQPWAFLTSKILQSCRVFTVRNERYRSPRTGQEHDFFLIDSPFGTKDFSLEIPGGMLDDGDTPAGAAARELLEETGFAGDEPEFLGSVHPNPALQTNRCYTYLVRNAAFQKLPEQDSTEDVEVEIVPLKDIPKLIQEGVITHALVIAAFYWYFSKTGFERL
jgi:ADP-ribose pyrophosphatase